jgi:hypothetical protein
MNVHFEAENGQKGSVGDHNGFQLHVVLSPRLIAQNIIYVEKARANLGLTVSCRFSFVRRRHWDGTVILHDMYFSGFECDRMRFCQRSGPSLSTLRFFVTSQMIVVFLMRKVFQSTCVNGPPYHKMLGVLSGGPRFMLQATPSSQIHSLFKFIRLSGFTISFPSPMTDE